jgi:hypothetical protein
MVEALYRDPEIKIVRIKNRLDPSYDPSSTFGYRFRV